MSTYISTYEEAFQSALLETFKMPDKAAVNVTIYATVNPAFDATIATAILVAQCSTYSRSFHATYFSTFYPTVCCTYFTAVDATIPSAFCETIFTAILATHSKT